MKKSTNTPTLLEKSTVSALYRCKEKELTLHLVESTLFHNFFLHLTTRWDFQWLTVWSD